MESTKVRGGASTSVSVITSSMRVILGLRLTLGSHVGHVMEKARNDVLAIAHHVHDLQAAGMRGPTVSSRGGGLR